MPSASSSQIENLTAGARQLGLAEPGASDSVNAQLVVSNVRAMQAALVLSDRIDANAIIDMRRELLVASRPEIVASFVPPNHPRVPTAIDDLLRFIRRDDVSALPAVALHTRCAGCFRRAGTTATLKCGSAQTGTDT